MKRWLLIGLIVFSVPLFLKGAAFHEPFTGLVITFSSKPAEAMGFQVRTLEKRGWSEWQNVGLDEDADEHESKKTNDALEMFFAVNESTDYQYRFKGADVQKFPEVKIEPFRYGKKRNIHPKWKASISLPSSVNVISRQQWGANEELLFENPETGENGNGDYEDTAGPETQDSLSEIERVMQTNEFGRPYLWPLQYSKNVKFIVVHHTASVKNLDNPEVAIQNIYYYHAVRRGWGDIGYNYLIDPKGNIYEGRYGGNKVIGAHVRGMNYVSVGIGILGNHDEGEISPEVFRSLLALTNTLSKRYGIDPDGSAAYKEKTYKNIIGHKDAGNTVCPGRFLYQKLFGTRELVASAQTVYSQSIFQDFEDRDFIAFPPESKKTFTVKLKNTGMAAWNSAFLKNPESTALFEDFSFKTNLSNPLVAAVLTNAPVAPGGTGIFTGEAQSSIMSGLFYYEPKLAVNGGDASGTKLPLAFFVEGVLPSYEVTARQDPRNTLISGETATGFIELRNLTNVAWQNSGDHPIRLMATNPRWRTSAFTGSTVLGTLFQEKVLPGEMGRFTFSLKAPSASGTYTEYFAPEISGVRYLEDQSLSFTITVKSAETSASAIQTPSGNIRVKLSFPGKTAEIQGSTPVILYNGNTRLRTFTSDVVFKISKTVSGKFYVRTPTKTYFLSGPVRLKNSLPDGHLKVLNWARRDNEFRNLLEIRAVDNAFTLVNELPLELYLAGVAEEPNDAPFEKLKTLSILERSYAKFYMTQAQKFPGKPYHLDDDPKNSQKYLGFGFEKRAPNVVKAVIETRWKVVTYQGKLVKTPYFSQSDGRTRSALEAFSWTNTPYLQSVPDPDCEGLVLRGHGVGLSGCGAKAKALRGETYDQIIKYYYQGVEISSQN